MFFSQSNIIVGKKKGPDLAVWAYKSTLRGVEETTSAKIQNRYGLFLYCCDDFSIAGAMLRCTISVAKIRHFQRFGYKSFA
jgi:hypothetical protein